MVNHSHIDKIVADVTQKTFQHHCHPHPAYLYYFIPRDGKLYWHTTAKPDYKRKHHLGSFACQLLCGKHLHRPHLTCVFCRTRRIWYGKVEDGIEVKFRLLFDIKETPDKIYVKTFLAYVNVYRKFANIKDILLKPLWGYVSKRWPAKQKHMKFILKKVTVVCEFLMS